MTSVPPQKGREMHPLESWAVAPEHGQTEDTAVTRPPQAALDLLSLGMRLPVLEHQVGTVARCVLASASLRRIRVRLVCAPGSGPPFPPLVGWLFQVFAHSEMYRFQVYRR